MRCDVLVVGAGPVGMDVACRLILAGRSVRVLERRDEPTRHSRSIGVHPPSLEALTETGVTDRLIPLGVQVAEGFAHVDRTPIGRLSFEHCPGPYRFVLAVPQWQTERVLEARLAELDPDALVRGEAVVSVEQDERRIRIGTARGSRFEASWLVGCDGRTSTIRTALGIPWTGRPYADSYVMGDFADDTPFGPRAGIFLAREGLVESFPLPGGLRRWVVRTPGPIDEPDPGTVAVLVTKRTGYAPDPASACMTSGFGVERRTAGTMAAGRILLAGDAAHVVSPIGGQGMNLGWLDARDAVLALRRADDDPRTADRVLAAYSAGRRRAARRAGARAEFNMWFGRPGRLWPLKGLTARLLLAPPLSGAFARRFTMRGL